MIIKKPYLSLVIPAYNEEGNFKKGMLLKVKKYLKKQKFPWEVIVVDDGSVDNTSRLIDKFVKKYNNFHLIKNPHYGKAHAVTTGVIATKGQYILLTDFDQATPLSQIKKMWPKINEGSDIVIGSREGQSAKRFNEPFYRHFLGRIFNFAVQLFVIRGIDDTQCGFKLFTQESARNLFSKLIVYKNQKIKDAYTGAWDVEVIFLAKKFGYKISQVPVEWYHKNTSRVSIIKDPFRMLRDILFIRWNDIIGNYKK